MEGTQKKNLINMCSFIFPLAWAVYRKMYKVAILVFAFYIALVGITVSPVLMNDELMNAATQCIMEDPEFGDKLLLYSSGQNVTFTKTQSEFIALSENFELPVVVVYGTMIASILMRVLMGLYGTKLYKNKLTKNIERVKKLPLEESQKKSYLKTKYGVTPMFVAICVGFIEYILFGIF